MEIPDVKYNGTFYDAEEPDTFDIAERAALGIRGISGCVDRDMDYQMWFFVRYDVRKPYMLHTSGDIANAWKLLDCYAMLRLISGSDEHIELENKFRAHSFGHIKDGLLWDFYDEKINRPYRVLHNPTVPGRVRHDEDLAYGAAGVRVLQSLLILQQINRSPVWGNYAEEIMDGFLRIAIAKDDYLYLPSDGGYGHPFCYPASGWLSTREPEGEHEGSEGSVLDQLGFPLLSSAMWHRFTGNEKALDIARRLYNFCSKGKFWGGTADPNGPPKGSVGHVAARLPDPAGVAGSEMGHWQSHFHARARALRGILEYGTTGGDINAIEFAKRGYEFSWSMGIPRLGWINCYPVVNNVMEGCAAGDLIALAIKLSDAGVGDYWDDAEAVLRNTLAEAQYTREDLMREMIEGLRRPDVNSGIGFDNAQVPGMMCDEDVLTRTRGVILANLYPSYIQNPWVMHCCTGNGLQGFYYAWEGAVRENGESAQVNMLFNRASKGLDIYSWLPFQGKVSIKNKSMKNIAVRIPGWADKKKVRQFVNGLPTNFMQAGNYICFTNLSTCDEICIDFPVQVTTNRYTAGAQTAFETAYEITSRGSTVVDISPRPSGEGIYPIFLRDGMKTETEVKMKKTRRYVPERFASHW